MAEISFTGLDDLTLSMQEIAAIPDDVQDEMLNAQADVVVAAQQAKARAYGVQDTGLVIRSIKKGKVKLRNGVRTIYVYPAGSRVRGKGVKTRNAEIGFVTEYGTTSQKARPFIRDANESSAQATTEAGFKVYDRWLKSKDL